MEFLIGNLEIDYTYPMFEFEHVTRFQSFDQTERWRKIITIGDKVWSNW